MATTTPPLTTTTEHPISDSDSINNFVSTHISPTQEGTWTNSNETTLKDFATKAQFYNSLYNESSYYYNRLNLSLNVIVIVFTIILANLQAITTALSYVNTNVQHGLLIACTSCTVVVGVFGGLQKQFNADVKASNSKMLAQQFMSFVNKVNNLLSINRTYRVNPDYTLMQFGDEYQKLVDQTSNTIVPESVRNKVIKMSALPPTLYNGVDVSALQRSSSKQTTTTAITTKISQVRPDSDGIVLNSV